MKTSDELEATISSKLKKFKDREGNSAELLREIHEEVAKAVGDVFARKKFDLSTQALSWVTSNYFKKCTVNGKNVKDLIVTNDYTFDEMSYNDIRIMNNVLNDTWLGEQLNEEFKKRNVS